MVISDDKSDVLYCSLFKSGDHLHFVIDVHLDFSHDVVFDDKDFSSLKDSLSLYVRNSLIDFFYKETLNYGSEKR